jgi:hypothetical protein
MQVENYTFITSGRKRVATRVILNNGGQVIFSHKLTKRDALSRVSCWRAQGVLPEHTSTPDRFVENLVTFKDGKVATR